MSASGRAPLSAACWCFLGLWVVVTSVSEESVFESPPPSMIQGLRTVLVDLAKEGGSYLGKLAEEQTIVSVRKAFSEVLGVLARGAASGLNVLFQYITHFLQAAGINAALPMDRVTPEGLIFVLQWLALALIGYWLISLCVRLVMATLRRALWLLKLGMAVVAFGFILNDPRASTETTAIRLAILVFVCVLLRIGPSQGDATVDKTDHLEEQVKTLERRIKQMERLGRKDK